MQRNNYRRPGDAPGLTAIEVVAISLTVIYLSIKSEEYLFLKKVNIIAVTVALIQTNKPVLLHLYS